MAGRPRISFTPRRQDRFLRVLARTGDRRGAAVTAMVNLTVVNHHVHVDPDFAKRYHDAQEEAIERLSSEAYRRAVEGWEEPVFQGGVQVGVIQRYSDKLLEVMLKSLDPRFAPKSQTVRQEGAVKLVIEYGGIGDSTVLPAPLTSLPGPLNPDPAETIDAEVTDASDD